MRGLSKVETRALAQTHEVDHVPAREDEIVVTHDEPSSLDIRARDDLIEDWELEPWTRADGMSSESFGLTVQAPPSRRPTSREGRLYEPTDAFFVGSAVYTNNRGRARDTLAALPDSRGGCSGPIRGLPECSAVYHLLQNMQARAPTLAGHQMNPRGNHTWVARRRSDAPGPTPRGKAGRGVSCRQIENTSAAHSGSRATVPGAAMTQLHVIPKR